MNLIPWHVTIMRMVVPISILQFPLWGIMASIFSDGLDWNMIGITSKSMDEIYQNWDKSMDAYAYIFILLVVLRWKDRWARDVAVGLLAYRLTGQVIFLLTKWRPVLFIFPNVFENFVIVCLIMFWWTRKQKLNLNTREKKLLLAILVIPKVIQEYFQHVLVKQPWELFSLGSMIGIYQKPNAKLDTYLWIFLLYIIPITAFLIFLGKKKAKFPERARS